MLRNRKSRFSFVAGLCAAAIAASIPVLAQVTPIDLDGVAGNGAESSCELSVDTSGPVVTFINKVVNRTRDDAFDFSWPSAGPGGLIGHFPSPAPPTSPTKTVEWHWTTTRNVIGFQGTSCINDICFGKTAGSDPMTGSYCSLACLDDGIVLSAALNRSTGVVSVSWTGGPGPFTVFRSTSPADLVDLDRMPSLNALAPNCAPTVLPQTAISPFSDVPPPGGIFFYAVRGASCTTRKACSTGANCSLPGDGFCISRGPFGVAGRTWFAGNVSVVVSQGTLTTTFLQTFSPTIPVFHAESSATAGGILETYTNNSGADFDVTTPGIPPGCCPAKLGPHRLFCGGACPAYLDDEDNCGACDNHCAAGFYCSDGVCTPSCGEGETLCGNSCCGGDSCCIDGACVSSCDEGQTHCGDLCYDGANDNDHCGGCGACSGGTCCQGGSCEPLQCGSEQTACPDGLCPDFQSDNQHCGNCDTACTGSACCIDGVCITECSKGEVNCGGTCTTLTYDNANCGSCGTICAGDTCCVRGGCAPFVCLPDEAQCDAGCTDTLSDPNNCGACGNVCDSGFCCSNGQCSTECGSQSSPHPGYCPVGNPPVPVGRVCPETPPPTPGYCPAPAPAPPVPSRCGGGDGARRSAQGPPPLDPAPEEAFVCSVDPTSTTVRGDGVPVPICTPGGTLFTEVPSTVRVCGGGIPGVEGDCGGQATKVASGTFNRFVPVPIAVGDAFVSPYAIHVVSETSGDGMLQPGETGKLVIDLLNAGLRDITEAVATLEGPAVDLTGDGIVNPVGLTVTNTTPVTYLTNGTINAIKGTPASTSCTVPSTLQLASNATPFNVIVPAAHPQNTSRPLILNVSGKVNGQPKTFQVALSLGIAGACVSSAQTRDADGVTGLYSPMAPLVRDDQPVPYPAHAFQAGNTRPLKMDISCGGQELSNLSVDPPEIVGLTKNGQPIDLSTLYDSSTHAYTRLFHWVDSLAVTGGGAGDHWQYDLSTANLGSGRFVLTIRIAGRRNYISGFVLQ